MPYSDRYKSLSLRFTPTEWVWLTENYEKKCQELGVELSKHRYLKMLIKQALSNGKVGKICLD